MFKSLIFYILLAFLCCSACKEIDISSDEIPPLALSSVNTVSQKLKFMNEIIESEPNIAEYYYRRSLVFLEAKNWKFAQEDIEQAIKLSQNKANYFFTKALILEQTKKYREALAAAQMSENKGLRQVDLYMLLSRLYYETKQPIKTVQYLQKVKKIYPKKPEVYYFQGLISYDVEDTLNTIRYMNEAIAAQPEYTNAYKYLFRLYNKNSNPKMAFSVLKRALQQTDLQKDAELNEMNGDILLQLEQKDSAMVYYDKAVKADSTHWKSAYSLSNYHLEKKHYLMGINYLEKALKVNNKIVGGHYLLGAVYEYHVKNYTKAKENYEIAANLEPANTNIYESVRKMERKIAYEEYRKSPQFIIDQMRRKQDSLAQTPINSTDITVPKE
jgi:tetratricopeptide (TPR) repeat protein